MLTLLSVAGIPSAVGLLQRVFAVDVMTCPKCEGRMALKKVANTAEDVARVLAEPRVRHRRWISSPEMMP